MRNHYLWVYHPGVRTVTNVVITGDWTMTNHYLWALLWRQFTRTCTNSIRPFLPPSDHPLQLDESFASAICSMALRALPFTNMQIRGIWDYMKSQNLQFVSYRPLLDIVQPDEVWWQACDAKEDRIRLFPLVFPWYKINMEVISKISKSQLTFASPRYVILLRRSRKRPSSSISSEGGILLSVILVPRLVMIKGWSFVSSWIVGSAILGPSLGGGVDLYLEEKTERTKGLFTLTI